MIPGDGVVANGDVTSKLPKWCDPDNLTAILAGKIFHEAIGYAFENLNESSFKKTPLPTSLDLGSVFVPFQPIRSLVPSKGILTKSLAWTASLGGHLIDCNHRRHPLHCIRRLPILERR